MHSRLSEITYDVELLPGEALSFPTKAGMFVEPGHWVVSIRPAEEDGQTVPTRNHGAFLNSYAPEDEGLCDDYCAG